MTEIENKDWICHHFTNEIRCCSKHDPEYQKKGNCLVTDSIVFEPREGNWSPPYIATKEVTKVKCTKESGIKMCFFPRDLDAVEEWDNEAINRLRSKFGVETL